MKSIKISTKLIAAFGLMVSLLAGVTVIAYLQLMTLFGVTETIGSNILPSVETVNKINTKIANIRIVEQRHVNRDDPAVKSKAEEEIAQAQLELKELEKQYEPLLFSPEERTGYERFKSEREQYLAVMKRMLDISRQGDKEAAISLLDGESRKYYRASAKTLDELVLINRRDAERESKNAGRAFNNAISVLITSSLATLLIAVLAAIWIIRSITKPLNQAVQIADAVAAGDLTTSININTRDELGQLLEALRKMQIGLHNTVQIVRNSANGVASASSQIAAGNNDLSSRTEEQASALEQTAASMEELGSTVRQNADHSVHANQLAHTASTVAEKGGRTVEQVVTTMKGINESSRQIAEIIGVIDSIAFQTNILALNAAVEAARAGDQGRGFAVVAAEVRTLAQRSAEAAKQIKMLIEASVSRVDQGSRQVDEAGRTMAEVVTAIRRVTDIMGEISSASQEQSQGVAQVGEAITQMDQATQQNAALVEESAAAADALQKQANDLVVAVSKFKTSEKINSIFTPIIQSRKKEADKKILKEKETQLLNLNDNKDWDSF